MKKIIMLICSIIFATSCKVPSTSTTTDTSSNTTITRSCDIQPNNSTGGSQTSTDGGITWTSCNAYQCVQNYTMSNGNCVSIANVYCQDSGLIDSNNQHILTNCTPSSTFDNGSLYANMLPTTNVKLYCTIVPTFDTDSELVGYPVYINVDDSGVEHKVYYTTDGMTTLTNTDSASALLTNCTVL